MGDWLYLIIAIAVVGVLTLAGLLTSGRRRKEVPPPSGRTDVIAPPPTEADVATEAPPEPAVDTAEPVGEAPAAPTIEKPESTASRLVRLRQRLSRSQGGLGKGLLALLSRERLDEDTWEAIEDTLLTADVGVAPTQALVERLRTRLRVEGGNAPDAREVLREELIELVGTDLDRRVQVTGTDGKPGVVLVVGVNGAGKTTTVGKIARILVAEDLSVTLGAADTFRAAAVDQLATWAERAGAGIVRPEREGQDPASVAFQTIEYAKRTGTEIVLVDTAGRLHTKGGLMDELGKIKRVIEKQAPISEVLLVLDATTGQNGLAQAEAFIEHGGVTGLVLTKLDGSAKGGFVLAVQEKTGLPIKLIGQGEGIGDLTGFTPHVFAQKLVG